MKNTNLARFGAICVEKGQKERFLASDNDRNSQVTEEKNKSNYKSEEKERTLGGGGDRIVLVTLLVFILTMLVYVGVEGRGLFGDVMFLNSSLRYKYCRYSIFLICIRGTQAVIKGHLDCSQSRPIFS